MPLNTHDLMIELQMEECCTNLTRHRTILVEAHTVRTWMDCDKISEVVLEKLVDRLDINRKSRSDFWGQLKAEYRADKNGFGYVILKAYVKTPIEGKSYHDRKRDAENKKNKTPTSNSSYVVKNMDDQGRIKLAPQKPISGK